MLYQSSDKLGSNGLRSFIDTFNYDTDSKEVDIEVNPLCSILDEDTENKDIAVDIDMPSLEELTIEKDNKNTFIEKNFEIVSKAMFGEVIENPEDLEEDIIQLNGHVVHEEKEENLKEIVETVKNAVLSYRNEQENISSQCNVNVIDIEKENCDNLNSRLGSHSNCSGDGGNNISDGDLNMYNSYNYWRISPELPLEPSIVDAGRSPTPKNDKILENHGLVVSISFSNFLFCFIFMMIFDDGLLITYLKILLSV